MSGKFAVVDKSTDNNAHVNMSRYSYALIDVDTVAKTNRMWFCVVCTLMENDIRRHIGPLPQQILTTVMTNTLSMRVYTTLLSHCRCGKNQIEITAGR